MSTSSSPSSSPQPHCPPYPLRFAPILKPKVWGGDRLARLGKNVAPGGRVGESWELADLAKTSEAEGGDGGDGGGGEERSIITNGPLTGQSIHDALALWGNDLLGDAKPTPDNAFPLLVKYLDAREHLSVQVHPSEAYAAAHPEAHLKTECWYVIDAEPGSVVYAGLKPGVTREAFAAGIADGTCVEMLNAFPASRGQMFFLPSGTCHALGAGVLVAEIQTPSDTTFRVYDWAKEYGRVGRELHIERAMACINFGAAPSPTRLAPGETAGRLVDCPFFTVDEARLEPGDELPMGTADSTGVRAGERSGAGGAGGASGAVGVSGAGGASCVLMLIEGRATLAAGLDVKAEPLHTGNTLLIPASQTNESVLTASEPTTLLRAMVKPA